MACRPEDPGKPRLNTKYEIIQALIQLGHCSQNDPMTLVGAATLHGIIEMRHPELRKRLMDDELHFQALQKQFAAKQEASK